MLPTMPMPAPNLNYIMISGILGAERSFKPLNWANSPSIMFSLGIAQLIAWLTAAEVQVTEIHDRQDVCAYC
jgi:hypothetical protein